MPASMDEIDEMLDGALQDAQQGSWKTEERQQNGGDPGEELCAPPEAEGDEREPSMLKSANDPSRAEVEGRRLTHTQYRSWCA